MNKTIVSSQIPQLTEQVEVTVNDRQRYFALKDEES